MQVLNFQVGGLLGLCIGFSLASGVEILYWLTARLWSEVNKKRRTTSADSREKLGGAWEETAGGENNK